ncbi:MAG: O-antigen ligase domain-containing protein [Hyphomicrobiales bacterium]|nr:MAG: O-antigen ligase domain-containing protein [Hyphomicrobiales bacterium]
MPSTRVETTQEASHPGRLHWLVLLFLVGLVVPWIIYVGPLRFSVYRLILLGALVPCLVIWARGGAGRIRLADLAVLGFCAWGAVCLLVNHRLSGGVQPSGILFIESASPYFLARCFIRTEQQFASMVRVLFWIMVFLLPFGLIELVTGYKPLLRLLGSVMPTIDETLMDMRWGLRRVQGPFEHPILFGVFCGGILSMTFLVLGYRQPAWKRWGRTLLVTVTSILSLSSGPISALVAQGLLLGWNWVLGGVKSRWKILWGLVVGSYVVITVYTGKSVASFYITHAPLFDSWSAYYRLLIWEHGSATVARHPLFGIGLYEYERPYWMAPSVDMFWLNNAIMFGVPGAILLVLIVAASAASIGLRRNLNEKLYTYRAAYLISMGGFFIAGWGVHFWNGTYSYFLFLVGSGLWLAEQGQDRAAATQKVSRRAGTPIAVSDDQAVAGRPSRGVKPAARNPGRRQGVSDEH